MPDNKKLLEATEPTRAPNFPFFKSRPTKTDTSWHDDMVKRANASFQPAAQKPAAKTAPKKKARKPALMAKR